MIRWSDVMLRFVLPALLTAQLAAQMAAAQGVTTDAFGILPTDALGDRANWAGLRQSDDGSATRQTAGPTDAVILFVGPKSIVAGAEPGHAVALGLDVFGNMVNGAPAGFALGYGQSLPAETRHGIADVLFTPPPEARNHLAGAEVGGVQSARADYRVTAHLATVQPQVGSETGTLLPETFGEIATAPLTDAYGNIVDDGVGVSMVLTDSTGAAAFLPAVVRDGAARGTLLARDLSGPVTGQIALAGTAADGIGFEVAPMGLADVGDFALWAEPAIGAVQIRLGPLATANGYLVPDGTAGRVEVTASDGAHHAAQGWVLDGYLSFVLLLAPDYGPFEAALTVAGTEVTRRVEVSAPPQNLNIRGAE